VASVQGYNDFGWHHGDDIVIPISFLNIVSVLHSGFLHGTKQDQLCLDFIGDLYMSPTLLRVIYPDMLDMAVHETVVAVRR
jgi:hypothetical protein